MKRHYFIYILFLIASVFAACSKESDDIIDVDNTSDAPAYELKVDGEYTYTKTNEYSVGLFKMAEYRVVYSTTDYNGEKVNASMYLGIPETPKRVIIDCHATIAADKQAPSYSRPAILIDAIIPMLNAICIAPDYIGYGESNNQIHAFADPLLHGRTVRDAIKVAYDMATNKLGKTLPETLPSYITGASQGGGVAIATQRAIEEEEGFADFIQLRDTYITSSALNFAGITKVWTTEWKENAFPSGLVLALLSMVGEKEVSEDFLSEILTEEYLESGIVDIVKKKEMTSGELIEYTITSLYPTYKDTTYPIPNERIFTSAIMDETSETYNKAITYMSKGNAWKGWTPKHTIHISHAKEDNIVPFAQSQELKTYLDDINYTKYTFDILSIPTGTDAGSIHGKACTLGYTMALQKILSQQ